METKMNDKISPQRLHEVEWIYGRKFVCKK